ncbi:MAG TPA: hypothetical protein VK553_07655 [Candidatus Nitrosopolaris rasttigaisensis]|nr:hypothetical protein [Candidatus Nitrosopolaris rasttigaisensis]
MAAPTVKHFVIDAYQLISANSPTVPLQGNDMSKGVQFLNELLLDYSSSSLMLTIAKKIELIAQIGQRFVTFAGPDFVPPTSWVGNPDYGTTLPTYNAGRLSNLEDAWLELDGVTYPLIDEARGVFFGSYKFEPQLGLPRFAIITNDLDYTTMQLYPAPSQQYNLFIYGKFQLPSLTENSDMSLVPAYYYRYLKFALARDLAYYKGRSAAWTDKLELMFQEAKDNMESVSAMNLVIDSANESYLNGSWRLRAGV